ncbi:hypothetical protein J3R82DRAFT_11448 [Butyriboletus roseoflavus]|nr:hypothetical protein J3R82DRAFT_11448 [Butyriboletus roseoflavus]
MHSPSRAGAFWKGKGKVPAQDCDNLRPALTYRHLRAHNLGVKDLPRDITLRDNGAFYVICELSDKALSMSLSAIRTANSAYRARVGKTEDAKKKCPNLVDVQDGDFKKEPGYWPDVDWHEHTRCLH